MVRRLRRRRLLGDAALFPRERLDDRLEFLRRRVARRLGAREARREFGGWLRLRRERAVERGGRGGRGGGGPRRRRPRNRARRGERISDSASADRASASSALRLVAMDTAASRAAFAALTLSSASFAAAATRSSKMAPPRLLRDPPPRDVRAARSRSNRPSPAPPPPPPWREPPPRRASRAPPASSAPESVAVSARCARSRAPPRGSERALASFTARSAAARVSRATLALEPVLHQLELAGGVAAPGLGGVRAAALRVRLLSRALDVRARASAIVRACSGAAPFCPPPRAREPSARATPAARSAGPRPQLLSHRASRAAATSRSAAATSARLQRRVEPWRRLLDRLLRRLRGRHGLHHRRRFALARPPLRRAVRLQRSRRRPKRRDAQEPPRRRRVSSASALSDCATSSSRSTVSAVAAAMLVARSAASAARDDADVSFRARELLELALERLDALEARTDDVVALAHVPEAAPRARALLRRGLRQRRVVLGLSPVHPERRREVLDALLRVEELHLHVRVRPGLGVRQLQKLLGRHVRREAQQTVVPPVVSRRVLVAPPREGGASPPASDIAPREGIQRPRTPVVERPTPLGRRFLNGSGRTNPRPTLDPSRRPADDAETLDERSNARLAVRRRPGAERAVDTTRGWGRRGPRGGIDCTNRSCCERDDDFVAEQNPHAYKSVFWKPSRARARTPSRPSHDPAADPRPPRAIRSIPRRCPWTTRSAFADPAPAPPPAAAAFAPPPPPPLPPPPRERRVHLLRVERRPAAPRGVARRRARRPHFPADDPDAEDPEAVPNAARDDVSSPNGCRRGAFSFFGRRRRGDAGGGGGIRREAPLARGERRAAAQVVHGGSQLRHLDFEVGVRARLPAHQKQVTPRARLSRMSYREPLPWDR